MIGATDYERVSVPGRKERGVVRQRVVDGGGAAADRGGARLPRAVGCNWRRSAVAGRPCGRIGDRLLGDVLRAVARTIDRSLGHEDLRAAGRTGRTAALRNRLRPPQREEAYPRSGPEFLHTPSSRGSGPFSIQRTSQ
jgi:hypothetical protein